MTTNRNIRYQIRIIKYSVIFLSSILSLVSCQNNSVKKVKIVLSKKANTDSIKSNSKYYVVEGPNFQIMIDGKTIMVPIHEIYAYKNPYKGIYNIIHGNSVTKSFCVEINNTLYFTTSDDAWAGYKGYLFAYDLRKKKFLTEGASKSSNAVFSSAGVFFLRKDYVFCFSKPYWYERKETLITSVDIYQIKGGKFHYKTSVYSEGDMASDDTSIVEFYNKNLKDDWRKSKVTPKNL